MAVARGQLITKADMDALAALAATKGLSGAPYSFPVDGAWLSELNRLREDLASEVGDANPGYDQDVMVSGPYIVNPGSVTANTLVVQQTSGRQDYGEEVTYYFEVQGTATHVEIQVAGSPVQTLQEGTDDVATDLVHIKSSAGTFRRFVVNLNATISANPGAKIELVPVQGDKLGLYKVTTQPTRKRHTMEALTPELTAGDGPGHLRRTRTLVPQIRARNFDEHFEEIAVTVPGSFTGSDTFNFAPFGEEIGAFPTDGSLNPSPYQSPAGSFTGNYYKISLGAIGEMFTATEFATTGEQTIGSFPQAINFGDPNEPKIQYLERNTHLLFAGEKDGLGDPIGLPNLDVRVTTPDGRTFWNQAVFEGGNEHYFWFLRNESGTVFLYLLDTAPVLTGKVTEAEYLNQFSIGVLFPFSGWPHHVAAFTDDFGSVRFPVPSWTVGRTHGGAWTPGQQLKVSVSRLINRAWTEGVIRTVPFNIIKPQGPRWQTFLSSTLNQDDVFGPTGLTIFSNEVSFRVVALREDENLDVEIYAKAGSDPDTTGQASPDFIGLNDVSIPPDATFSTGLWRIAIKNANAQPVTFFTRFWVFRDATLQLERQANESTFPLRPVFFDNNPDSTNIRGWAFDEVKVIRGGSFTELLEPNADGELFIASANAPRVKGVRVWRAAFSGQRLPVHPRSVSVDRSTGQIAGTWDRAYVHIVEYNSRQASPAASTFELGWLDSSDVFQSLGTVNVAVGDQEAASTYDPGWILYENVRFVVKIIAGEFDPDVEAVIFRPTPKLDLGTASQDRDWDVDYPMFAGYYNDTEAVLNTLP